LHKSRIKLLEARLKYPKRRIIGARISCALSLHHPCDESKRGNLPKGKSMMLEDVNRHRGRFLGTVAVGIAVLAVVSVSAESADDLKPPVGYRQWFHVNTMIVDKTSPLFEVLGGMHNVHVNSVGESALRKGEPYPDGTVFLTDLHDFSVVDGSYVEGALKGLAMMAEDTRQYASTGGWGFQFWVEGDPGKPMVTDVTKQCFECHQPRKSQDYVYSTYIP
jgi:hypothetical protein